MKARGALKFAIFLNLVFPLSWSVQARAIPKLIVTRGHRELLYAGPGEPRFDVTKHIIPLHAIAIGALSKNSIPALINPRFVTVSQADKQLKSSDRVLGVVVNRKSKAYPVRILNWHELVNDTLGGEPILVSW